MKSNTQIGYTNTAAFKSHKKFSSMRNKTQCLNRGIEEAKNSNALRPFSWIQTVNCRKSDLH